MENREMAEKNQENKDSVGQNNLKQAEDDKNKLQKNESNASPYIKDLPPIDPARPGIL